VPGEPAVLATIGCTARLPPQGTAAGDSALFTVQGMRRVRRGELPAGLPCHATRVIPLPDERGDSAPAAVLGAHARRLALASIRLQPELPSDSALLVQRIMSPAGLVDFLAGTVDLAFSPAATLASKLALLAIADVPTRLAHLVLALSRVLEVLTLRTQAEAWVRARLAPGDARATAWRLQEQFLLAELESSGLTPAEQDARLARAHEVDAMALGESKKYHLDWDAPRRSTGLISWLRRASAALGPNLDASITAQLAQVRVRQREEAILLQLEALAEALRRTD
jgi:hypothetical protein